MPVFNGSDPDTSEQRVVPPPPSYPLHQTTAQPEIIVNDSGGRLDPWLGLRARLFLSIVSYGIVSLIFVGTRLLISASQVDNEVQRSNDTLWNACRETEQAASTLASFPHLLADNFNNATKRSVDDTVQGLGKVLLLSITALESLLVFLVDMYRSLFLCFIQFVVQASLSLLISAVQLFTGVVHDAAQSIEAAIQGSIDALNATLATTLGGMNDILKVIGQQITVPTIPQPDLSALNNVTLPSTLQDSLTKLNNSLPTLADLKAKMDTLIQTPFEDLKRDVNSTISNFSFNQSALPLPQMQSITYCNNSLNTQPLEDLGHDLRRIRNIGIGLLVLLGLLFIAFSLVREWYSWNSLKRHVTNTRQAYLLSNDAGNGNGVLSDRSLFSLLQLSTHPLLAEWGLRGAERLGIHSTDGKTRVRWWLAWISHPVGIVLLIMGFVGFCSVELQIAAVNGVGDHYQGRFEHMLDSSVKGLQSRLDSTLLGVSNDYANKSNVVILQAQDALNDHLFQWVNVTTSTMNNTLNEFMDGIATVINSTFANTPLYSPVQSFIDCIIGQKVAGIEEALTWIQSHAQANFSMVPSDVLMVNPNTTQQVIQPVKDTALGSDGILDNLIGTYIRALEKERTMFLILLLLYLILFIIGTLIAVFDARKEHSKHDNDYSEEKYVDEKPIEKKYPHTGFTTADRSASPGVGVSHRSISQPLHPDVVSLYNQDTPYLPYTVQQTAPSNLRHVTNKSWESLLDDRNKSSFEDEEKRSSWIRAFPGIKHFSLDFAYSPKPKRSSIASSSRCSTNTTQERHYEEKGANSNKWRNSGSLLHDSFSLIPAPATTKIDSNHDSSYPTSCDSYFRANSISFNSFDYSSDQSHSRPPTMTRQDSKTGLLRNIHLSDITERPESGEEETLVFDGSQQSQQPRTSFPRPNQDQEIQLQRNTRQSIIRPGQAF